MSEQTRTFETLRSPSTGRTRCVLKGQRWLVVAQHNETAPTYLLAFIDREAADRMVDRLHRLGGMVQYVEPAEVVNA